MQLFDPVLHAHQPNDGTMWSSTGNYGSSIFDLCDDFDPSMRDKCLLLVICDDCLHKHRDLTHFYQAGELLPEDERDKYLATPDNAPQT